MLYFLIISITPINAVELNQSKSTIHPINTLNNDSKQLNKKITEIKSHTTRIQEYWDYIIDNWYIPWHWGAVSNKMDEIETEAYQIESIGKEMDVLSKKIEEDSKKLQEESNNRNVTVDESAEKNAHEIVKNLKEDLGLSLGVSQATNLKEGDIVQYKSQDKYYRYLKFIKSENNSVILSNGHNNIIILSVNDCKEHIKLKITPPSIIYSSKIVDQANIIQKNQLKNQINNLENEINTKNDVKLLIYSMLGAAAVLGILGLVFIGIGIVAGCFENFTLEAMLTALGISYIIIGGILTTASGILALTLKDPESELKVVNEDWDDFDSYQYGSPVVNNMNFTTNVNTKFNATFNVTSGNDTVLHYKTVIAPQHGTLKINNNGNFTYTPSNNYAGQDSFTYQVDNGILKSNIANVTIKIIPPLAPVANNMSLTINNGIKINTTFNAYNPYDNTLTFLIITPPKHGTVMIDKCNFIYIPVENFTGYDSFTYQANNGLISNTAKIIIHIKKSMKMVILP